jgi:hypothetical protein
MKDEKTNDQRNGISSMMQPRGVMDTPLSWRLMELFAQSRRRRRKSENLAYPSISVPPIQPVQFLEHENPCINPLINWWFHARIGLQVIGKAVVP